MHSHATLLYMTHLAKRNVRNELNKNEITMETTAAANGYQNWMQEKKNEKRRRNDETK